MFYIQLNDMHVQAISLIFWPYMTDKSNFVCECQEVKEVVRVIKNILTKYNIHDKQQKGLITLKKTPLK
jgi:hypothetical protein